MVSSPANYTCTNLADRLDGVGHDAISDYLARTKATAQQLWGLVQPLVTDTEQGYLIVEGMLVKLKELPLKVRLFKIAFADGGIDWVITNSDRPDDPTAHSVQAENEVHLQVEQLHQELKQLTSIQACQCRKARAQRTHIASCYHAWLSLKVIAKRLGGGKTLYQAKALLLSGYLRAQLRNPIIPAYGLA